MDKKNKNPNVPNLRFPSFSHDWKIYTFDDIASYKKGPFGSALKKDLFVPKSKESVKVYEQQNAINKDCHLERYFISANYYEKMKSFTVYPGDTIVSCAGTIGELYTLPENADIGIINQALMIIRNNQAIILKDFLNIQFSRMIDEFSKTYSNGSAIKNIPPFSDLKRKKTYVPDKLEQEKIIKFISLLDQKITTQIKIINSIESQIRAINNHIASDSTSSELNIASLFHVKTSNKLVESNTGKFCIVDMGTIDANGNYITGKYTDDETSLIPYGTLVMPKDDISGGKIICKTMCINSSNKYALSDHVFALKLKNDKYNPVYFSALINSQYNNHKLKKLVTGSAQLGINQENLNRYKLKFSDSLELQHKYSEIIVRLNEELIIEKRLLDLFSSQKKYLLKNMFV